MDNQKNELLTLLLRETILSNILDGENELMFFCI